MNLIKEKERQELITDVGSLIGKLNDMRQRLGDDYATLHRAAVTMREVLEGYGAKEREKTRKVLESLGWGMGVPAFKACVAQGRYA